MILSKVGLEAEYLLTNEKEEFVIPYGSFTRNSSKSF